VLTKSAGIIKAFMGLDAVFIVLSGYQRAHLAAFFNVVPW
jgi:hypothetical protein